MVALASDVIRTGRSTWPPTPTWCSAASSSAAATPHSRPSSSSTSLCAAAGAHPASSSGCHPHKSRSSCVARASGDDIRADPNSQMSRLRTFMGGMGMGGIGFGQLLDGASAKSPSQQQQQPLAQPAAPAPRRAPEDWGISGWEQDWDPEEDLDAEELETIADEAEEGFRERAGETPRDKWITPLLDFQSVSGAVDPDQERTEDNLQGEALANKDESQRALRYAAQLVGIPLVAGFIVSRALADPVLNFTLQNNEDAFAMTDIQKIEGAQAVHVEEARMRMDAAIGKAPPLSEERMLDHMREFAHEFEEEERHHNEQNLITVVSDSVSGIMLFGMLAQKSRGRQALFNTISRLFEGLSDIAKAVMIILIADTLLGYHSEEGWTGLFELVLGHYGVEAEEEGVVIFVGVVPVVIDVLFKYWIFVGLNKISPGAVVTIKQIDTH